MHVLTKVRLIRVLALLVIALGIVVATLTTADLVHLVHASLLLALGVGALLGRPRTG